MWFWVCTGTTTKAEALLRSTTGVDVFSLVHLDGGLLSSVTWLHVQVVGGLHAAVPCFGVDLHHVAEVTSFQVHVAADGLVDPLLCTCRNLEEGEGRELEAGLVDSLDVVWNLWEVLNVTLVTQQVFTNRLPDSELLEVSNKVAVDLKELTGAGCTA